MQELLHKKSFDTIPIETPTPRRLPDSSASAAKDNDVTPVAIELRRLQDPSEKALS